MLGGTSAGPEPHERKPGIGRRPEPTYPPATMRPSDWRSSALMAFSPVSTRGSTARPPSPNPRSRRPSGSSRIRAQRAPEPAEPIACPRRRPDGRRARGAARVPLHPRPGGRRGSRRRSRSSSAAARRHETARRAMPDAPSAENAVPATTRSPPRATSTAAAVRGADRRRGARHPDRRRNRGPGGPREGTARASPGALPRRRIPRRRSGGRAGSRRTLRAPARSRRAPRRGSRSYGPATRRLATGRRRRRCRTWGVNSSQPKRSVS